MTSVSINTSNIKSRVKAHLAIIGRRLNIKEGDKSYQRIVLTDNELDLVDDYIKAATAFLAAQFPEILTQYNGTSSAQSFDDASRRTTYASSALSDVYASYILSYSIGEYLATINIDMAKKYQQDAIQFLNAARNIIYSKTPPSTALPAKDFRNAPTTTTA